MTVTTTTSSQTFQGNGTATAFPCAFEIILATDVHVFFVNPLTGAQTAAVMNTDYTISGAGASNGFTVNTTVPVPTGTNLYVVRALPLTQPTDFTNQGAFFPTLHEAAMDRLCMLIQQIANYSEGLNITMPPGLVPQPSTLFPVPQGGSLIGWDPTGTFLANVGASGVGAGSITDVNIAAAAAIASTKIAFAQPSSGQFFAQNGAVINRFNDRLFLGGAALNDGRFPGNQADWFTAWQSVELNEPINSMSGTLAVLTGPNSSDAAAILAAAQSANFTAAGSACIGIETFVVNNHTSLPTQAWGHYIEAHHETSAAGVTYGMEIDVRTRTLGSTPDPYTQGAIVGLQLAAGAGTQGAAFTGVISGNTLTVSNYQADQNYEIAIGTNIFGAGVTSGTVVTAFGTGTGGNGTYTVSHSQTVASEYMVASPNFDVSCAIQIENNPNRFAAGIVFGNTSLIGADGTGGGKKATAIALAAGHQIQWYSSAGIVSGSIASTNPSNTNAVQLVFTNLGLQIAQIASGSPAIAYFVPTANGVNYLSFGNNQTGGAPYIGAFGTDTNVDLALLTQGSGVLKFGTYTAAAPAATGYITIKDSSGNTRKLLCA